MGFRVDHTLMMSVDLGLQGYSEERGQQFYKQISDRVKSLPGVRDASFAAYIPMGYENDIVNVYPDGQPVDNKSSAETSFNNQVQPDYFRAVGVHVIKGREFTEADSATAPVQEADLHHRERGHFHSRVRHVRLDHLRAALPADREGRDADA